MSQIEQRYRQRTPRSGRLADAASAVMPGGDTRAAAHYEPHGVTLERGEGPFVWDADGHRHLDLSVNYTSLVHGHACPPVVEAIREWAGRGTAWSARCEPQIALAELLVERVASVDTVRFTNSGTEAAMLAIHIARLLTGPRKILMARHGYHGSMEETEIGLLGVEGPSTVLADHGDAAAFERVLEEHGGDIACALLEPVMGAGGIVPSPPGFLARVATAARRAGSLFILDEVICFRLATGGAQSLHDVTPDLTMFGRLIGGGLPVGAVGGHADVMAVSDPRAGRMFVSGTFNGNPLTTAAGTVAVRELTGERIAVMHQLMDRLRLGLEASARRHGLPFAVHHAGSLLNVFFSPQAPRATIVREDAATMRLSHLACLNHGVFIAPRGMMALSTVVTDALVTEIVERADAAMADVAREAA